MLVLEFRMFKCEYFYPKVDLKIRQPLNQGRGCDRYDLDGIYKYCKRNVCIIPDINKPIGRFSCNHIDSKKFNVNSN